MPPTLVPPVTAEGISVKGLNEAIDIYRYDAAKLFVQARQSIPALPGEKPEDTEKRRRGQFAAAFQQLSTAEAILSAQQGREGFDAVVELMKSTQKTASAICTQLTALVTPPAGNLFLTSTELAPRLPIIEALTAALQVLAQISPAAGWQKPPSSGSGG